MFTSLKIENFKAWRRTGELRLAPLTVLFGPNSAGKSSLTQFLLMLKQTIESSDRTRVLHPGDRSTIVQLGTFDADQTVRAYKDLSKVERAFRSMKTVDLKVRPIYHRRADRVRAHVLLCMLAYYVEWHMRSELAPVLFDDHDPEAGEQQRSSVVRPAQRSPAAQQKAASKRTADDLPVHSFRSLMNDLGTLTVNKMQLAKAGSTFLLPTQPTPVQQRCFELLGVSPRM